MKKILIIGPNGSGKTTYITNLYKQNECRDIFIESSSVQKQDSIFRNFKIKDMISECSESKQNRLLKLFANFKLEYVFDKKLIVLSGGELKLINIIFQLLDNKSTIFIDEIEKDLDSTNIKKILNILNNKKQNIYLVTHNEFVFSYFKKSEILMFENFEKKTFSKEALWKDF